MNKKNKKCFDCNINMKLTKGKTKGVTYNLFQCPKCKRKVLNEDQFDDVIFKLEAKRLEERFKRNPFEIGHSLAITFPKDIVDNYHLTKKSNIEFHQEDKKNIRMAII